MRRKPAPSAEATAPISVADRSLEDPFLDQQTTNPSSVPSIPASHPSPMSFDDIDRALTEMQHRFVTPGRPAPSPSPSAKAALPQPHSTSSAATNAANVYQGRLGSDYPQRDQETDPFLDSSQGAYPTDVTQRRAAPSFPRHPALSYASSNSHNHAQGPYDMYTHYEDPQQSRPLSAYSHHSPVDNPPPSSYAGVLPANSFPQHLGLGVPERVVDHFNHDTEAYASGMNTRAGRQYVRSRSATPMGDESYEIVDHVEEEYDNNAHDPEKYGYFDSAEAQSQYLYPSREGTLDEKTPISDYPETPLTTQHYGPAPIGRVKRRHNQKKRVQLTNGNLVLDLDVPTKMVLPRRGEEEMSKMRYTAVTCDPDDFERSNFFLRQNEYGRTTEMFIVITMYNVSIGYAPGNDIPKDLSGRRSFILPYTRGRHEKYFTPVH